LSASSSETNRILEAPAAAAEAKTSTLTELTGKLEHYAKWLRPGMRVKRWLIVAMLGIAILVAGVDLMFLLQLSDLGDQLNEFFFRVTGKLIVQTSPLRAFTYQALLGIPTATLGLLIFLYGVRCMLSSVTSAVAPPGDQSIADVIWRRRQLAQGARIVVIGGGTGLSTMLRGLKEYTSNITAVVTVTDDGGSSGRLQREFGMLPPGDIRNCLVALADAEPLMQQLFQYRFGPQGRESGLTDHSFGNLLIAAMVNITDDFEEAVRQTSRVLAIRGRVLPSTTRSTMLVAEMEDGTVVEGETSITKAGKKIKSLRLSDDVEPLEEALEAIRTADAIVIGPGSVFTSVLPNFLVRGVAEAVADSPALKLYVCNLMTQPGESDGFSAGDHVRTVLLHAGKPIIDYALINTEEPSAEMKQRYGGVGAEWVRPDPDDIRRLGVRPVTGRFLSRQSVVRHDHERLAEEIVRLTGRRTSPLFWFMDQRA
jgi:uncharacterized cofD-like protein